jgi:hypothetical protein
MKNRLSVIAVLISLSYAGAAQVLSTYEAIELNRAAWPYILFKENGTTMARIQGTNGYFSITGLPGTPNYFTVNSTSGNIGIGTNSPADQLEVVSANRKVGFNTSISGIVSGGILSLSRSNGSKVFFLGTSTATDSDPVIYGQGGGAEVRFVSAGLTSAGFGFYSNTEITTAFGARTSMPTPLLKITGDGNVGIGTATPGSFKLAVNGKIWSQEVNVAMNNPGPDYVFEKDYNLLSLADVETFINENKHLPEIPSAKEMEKDGLNLKEMNLLLLKKVEELTLHLIDQSKKLQDQQTHLQSVEEQNLKMKVLIDQLIAERHK